jgi:hypothetical protein
MPNSRTGQDYLDTQEKKNKKKKHNPFEGQKIKINGKWVERTPSNSPGGKP